MLHAHSFTADQKVNSEVFMKHSLCDRPGQSNSAIYYGMYILSLLIFGTNGLLVSHITIAPSQIVMFRTMIGGLFLSVLVLLRGGFDRNTLRAESIALVLGGTMLGLNWITLFEAYKLLNVSLATLIYYVGPILVLVFSPVFFHEKLSAQKIAAVILVFIGLFFISGSIAQAGMNMSGLLAAALSALFYAALIVFNKRIVQTSGMQTAALELDVAFVVVLAYTLVTTGFPEVQRSDVPYIAVIGLVNTGAAYLLYFTSLQKLSGQSVALLSYVDPVSALFFSAVFLQEKMTFLQCVGAILILGGAMFGEVRKRTSAST